MLPKAITSLQHPLVKHLVKLRKERRYRQETQSLLILGKKLVAERKKVSKLFIEEGSAPLASLEYDELFVFSQAIFEKISGMPSPEPFAAELPLPLPTDLSQKQKLLALDGISDPGNLGTLVRTAVALGFEGIFLTEDSTDLFNEKTLRAAKGATFHLPYQIGSQQDLWHWIKNSGLHPYVGDLKGKNLSAVSFSLPLILILGNEAHGPSSLIKENATLVTIPLADQTESLNVGIAGGILMYAISEKTWQK